MKRLFTLCACAFAALALPHPAFAHDSRIRLFSEPSSLWNRYRAIENGRNLPTTIRTLTEAELLYSGLLEDIDRNTDNGGKTAGFAPILAFNPYLLGWSGLETQRWSANAGSSAPLPSAGNLSRRSDPFYANAFRLADPVIAFGVTFASEHLYASTEIDFNTDTIASKKGASGYSAVWQPLDWASYMSFPEQAYLSWTGEQSSIVAGRIETGVGLGRSNLLLNGQARWYDQIQYNWWSDAFRFFAFWGTSATHLMKDEREVQYTLNPPGSDETSNTGWDPASNHDYASGDLAPVKLFTAHRAEFKPHPRLGLGISEFQVIGGKVPDLTNLLPVVYWHNTYTAGVSNVILHVDAWGVPVDGLLLRGEFLMDDTKSAAEQDAESKPNSWAWQLGATWVLPLSSRDWKVAVEAEYSHVDTWTYNRWQPWLVMYQRQMTAGGWYGYDIPLGHPAGGNLDEGTLNVTGVSKTGIRVEAGYSVMIKGPVYLGQIIKGTDPDSGDTVYIPVYYDFDKYKAYTNMTLADIEEKPNLYRHTISLSAEVPLAKSLTAQAGAEFRFTQNAGHVRGATAFESIWKAGCRWSL